TAVVVGAALCKGRKRALRGMDFVEPLGTLLLRTFGELRREPHGVPELELHAPQHPRQADRGCTYRRGSFRRARGIVERETNLQARDGVEHREKRVVAMGCDVARFIEFRAAQ